MVQTAAGKADTGADLKKTIKMLKQPGSSTVVCDIEESRFLPMQGDIEVGPQWSAKPTRRKYTLLEDLLKAEIAML